MTTEVLAPSELALSIAVEEDEKELVGEFRELSLSFTEHILMYLGGVKVDRRIVAACNYLGGDRKKTDTELWYDAEHEGRVRLLEERIQVLKLVRSAFDLALETELGRDNWLVHLNRMFPGKSLMTIVIEFQRENESLRHRFQCLINDLRCIRIGAYSGFWSEDDPIY
ncbi:MAG TPA: hypothetical protein O0X40_06760 [Methanocorpusculum sp.]|nr:hypothetical protein [Methanocorpusculum sp.]